MIRIGKLEAVLAAFAGTGVPVRSRLQYLAVNDFPPGLRVGRARRADYGLDEIWASCLVFATMRAGVAPATSTAIVTDYWPEISRALLSVGDRLLNGWRRTSAEDHTFLTITAERLPEAIRGNDLRAPARPYSILIQPLTANIIVETAGTGGAVIIDLDQAFTKICTGLTAAPNGIGEEAIEAALRELDELQGRTQRSGLEDAPSMVKRQAPEPPARGERLREMDFYLSRAAELAASAGHTPLPPRRRATLIEYIRDPAAREAWKQWIEIANEVPLALGLQVLVSDVLSVEPPASETVTQVARFRLEAVGLGDPKALAAAIGRAAAEGMRYSPVADH